MTKKRLPPSRLKYERENPSLTIRLTREIREILDQVAKKEELTYSAIVKDSFLKAAKSYDCGYKAGYNDAKKQYKITYPCSVCYGDIVMSSDSDTYEAITEYLFNEGWGHAACHNSKKMKRR